MSRPIKNRVVRIAIKSVIGLTITLLLLFFMVWAILKVPVVQNFLVHKATSFVSSKTHTRVELAYIDLQFPKSIVLKGIFMDTPNKDTLLSVGEVQLDIGMLALLRNKVSVQQLTLQDAHGRLTRTVGDSAFNFQFLINAFSSSTKKIDTTQRKPSNWTFEADHVALRNCRFEMEDAYGGLFLHALTKEADVELRDLDLATQSVSVGDTKLVGVDVRIRQTQQTTDTTTTAGGQGWDKVSVHHLAIEQSVFSYDDPFSCLSIFAKVGHAELGKSDLSLVTQTIHAGDFKLTDSRSSLQLEKDTTISPVASAASSKDWNITLSEASLSNNDFKMDFTNVPTIAHGFDWNHLSLQGIGGEITDALYNGPVMKADIQALTVQERSGLGIRSLKTKFTMGAHQAELKELALQTNYSSIGQHIQVKYASLDQLVNTLQLNCSMVNNQLAMEDLLLLQPDLRNIVILKKNERQRIHFTLKAKGNTESLALSQLTVSAGTSTSIDIKGRVKQLAKPNLLFMDLQLKKIQSGKKDMLFFIPDSLLPQSVEIPDTFTVTGIYKGTLSDFNSQLSANSSFGKVDLDAVISALQSESPGYKLDLHTEEFHLGKLLKQTNMGTLSGRVKLAGNGKEVERMNSQVAFDIEKVEFNQYAYHDIVLNGKIDTGYINMQAAIKDSNAHALLDGKINLNKKHEAYDIHLDLKGADFKALGWTTDQLQVSAKAELLFKGIDAKNLNGHLDVRNILLIKDTKEYKIDSLVFAAINEDGNNQATLNSSMIAASFKGNIDLLSVVPTMQEQIDHYFHYLPAHDHKKTTPQNFVFEIQINDSPVLREVILPKLNSYENINASGGFNSDSAHVWFSLNLPELEYDDLTTEAFHLNIDSDHETLSYSTGWNMLKSGDLVVQQTRLTGEAAHDTVSVHLDVKDKDKMEKIVLHSEFSRHSQDHYRFRIYENGLMLQNNKWSVNAANFIEFGTKYLYVNKMDLGYETQSISAQSDSNHLGIRFKQFHLHTLAQIAEQDDSLVQGILDGEIRIKDLFSKPAFTSDLQLMHLAYKQSKIGNLDLQADNLTEDHYSMKAVLTGMNNKATISGYYAAKETNTLNFNVSIDSLQLASVESFSEGQINGSNGMLSGNVKLGGSLKEPLLNGELRFIKAGTHVTYLNEYVALENETLTVKSDGVHFNSFHIKDYQNNTATIDGTVFLKSFSDPTFDLKITTTNFLILNTTQVNNKLYYGKIYLDSKINLKGTPQLPVLTADLKIKKGSRFSFAIPESQASTDRGDGIVVFVKDPAYFDPIMLRQSDLPSANKIKGISLKAKVSVDKNTTFTLLVDPYAGDSLQVRGSADLNFSLDPSGEMGLSGRYIIADGIYKATLEGFVTKEFKIISGSKIQWYGDPLDAVVDVTARYDTRAKPTALMSIGSGLTPAESAAYSQPLPFYILMMMKGDLMQPQISFQLDMPENQKGAGGGAVYGKLTSINSDEAELNKQVFSLLVFNSFMASTDGSEGADASDFARSSVSRLMSDQLNKLSSQYIKGVDVNVDLVSYNQEDVTTSQKQGNTALQVGVKKTLFNERLSVQVGGNVMLEGQQSTTDPTQTNSAQDITGDVVVEYKVTPNGRYKLKGFRLNQLDGVTNGIITQTGVGVIFTRDYNRTRDLLQREKKSKEVSTDPEKDETTD